MTRTITPDDARDLWAWLSDEYFSVLVAPDDERRMRAVRWMLRGIGVKAPTLFLRSHAVSMGDTIYLPFAPGESSTKWPAVSQALAIVHEHVHVAQSLEYGGMVFAAGYFADRTMRAHLEGEALQATAELEYWLTGKHPDIERIARTVLAYGLGPSQVRYAEAMLRAAMPGLLDGQRCRVVQIATERLERGNN